MASLIVSGTPVATVDEDPKLERMSARTMPLCVRTSGPFEPSPGNGPAVSSGMTAQAAPDALAADVAAADPNGLALDPGVHPARAKAPAPNPRILRRWRRSISVSTSKARWGRGGDGPRTLGPPAWLSSRALARSSPSARVVRCRGDCRRLLRTA
jgi:hypothetical protein